MARSDPPDRSFAHVGVSSQGVARGVGWLASARLLGMLLSLLSTAVLARLLVPADFGLLILVAVTANLATQVVEGGVAVPLVQRRQISVAHIHMALILATLVAFVLAAGFALVALAGQALAGRAVVPGTVVIFAALAMPFRAWTSVLSAILQREGRFRENTIIALQSNLFGNVLPALALAWAGFQIYALLAGFIAATVIEAVLTARAARIPRFRRPPLAAARDFADASYAGTTMQVVNWAALSSPNFLIGVMFGATDLGLFSRGATLVNLAKDVLGSSLARVLLPAFAALESEPVRQRLAFERAMTVSLPIFALASVAIVIHAEAIVRIILGSAWMQSVQVLQLLALGLLPRISYKITDSLLMANGRLWPVAGRQGGYLLAIVAFSVAASRFGIDGVAAAVTAATTGYYLLSLRGALRRLGLNGRRVIRLHAAAALWALVCGGLDLGSIAFAAPLGFWPGQIAGGAGLVLAGAIAVFCLPQGLLGADIVAARIRILTRFRSRPGRGRPPPGRIAPIS